MALTFENIQVPVQGQIIGDQVPDHPIIPFIEGDGIGVDGHQSLWCGH